MSQASGGSQSPAARAHGLPTMLAEETIRSKWARARKRSELRHRQTRCKDADRSHGGQGIVSKDDAANARGLARGRVDVHHGAGEPRIVARHVERARHESNGRGKDAVDAATKNAVVGAGHADITDKCGAAGEDLLVG